MIFLQESQKIWRYVYSFTQNADRHWTDRRTDRSNGRTISRSACYACWSSI